MGNPGLKTSQILERSSSASNTSMNEVNLLEVAHNLPPTEAIIMSCHERPMGALKGKTHSAKSRALMVYLWFLVVTAGIPLIALCIQSDGSPHTTGGTEPEDEP